MADEDLLDNLDDGAAAAPAKKKKIKLPSGGGGNVMAMLPTVLGAVSVVLLLVVFMKLGSLGGDKGKEELEEALQALAKKQGEMIVALNNREYKVEGVELPGFHGGGKVERYYLTPEPMTLNVGATAFARTKVMVVVDKEVAEEMGHEAEGGKEGGKEGGGGHGGEGGGGEATVGAQPEWFTQHYAADIQQAVGFFFAQVQYTKEGGGYKLPNESKVRSIEFVRSALVTKINELLQKDPENKFRVRDLTFEGFVIDQP